MSLYDDNNNKKNTTNNNEDAGMKIYTLHLQTLVINTAQKLTH